ncbi:Prophage PSPPH06, virion morphoproteinsis protein [Pseudomonas cannabina pv. alisalensis]|uniref:Prophage PSPPH06, virion morphoproteinsis protein n=2 Tax=Pseudomonas cannabina TaxID=86840 RepID=A0A3M3S8Y5_PSECA|nr:phage virion morphogenesis protein [Pseudomonas cannabina]KPW22060.1 Prophage PSPPH06, virion morphoproteinsis protein [Pseudomonas cannabina pv. alisalensis]MBM0141730.1 phage virion morphogenesis protein [Pseudomonas cannabina pv. alisalensis]RMN76611.1 Prophage PSPPH06, virion morphoproteinsis protein [Pseudomonas cannabina pv. alisalensis]RMN78472.1 Prophage PSPPH06, virion morphoproteinsis protein [Pseudomonas cannabina]RMO05088.1 Prophage PssSM-01, virion morphoproteinsis protein [Pse
MAHSTFDLDIRGMLEAQDLLALMALPLPKRKRLLNNVAKRVRSLSRQRIRNQQNLDGTPFEARKDTSKGKKKMETGLGKLLDVTRLTGNEAELGWRNTLTRWVASQQHNGVSERRTAAQMRQWNKVPPDTAATEKQAKRLRRLGFKTRQEGKKIPTRPSVAWIQQHLNYARAGLLIRVLDDERAESTGAQSWDIKLPARQFLGASDSETSQLVNLVLQQILNSPR